MRPGTLMSRVDDAILESKVVMLVCGQSFDFKNIILTQKYKRDYLIRKKKVFLVKNYLMDLRHKHVIPLHDL